MTTSLVIVAVVGRTLSTYYKKTCHRASISSTDAILLPINNKIRTVPIFYLTDIKVKTDTNKKTNKNNIFKAPQKNTYVPTLYYTQ